MVDDHGTIETAAISFNQVSEFDKGRIVAYRDCGLFFREIGSRVGRNQTMTDRRGQSHPPQCTTSREERQIVSQAVTDRSVTSRTVAPLSQQRIIQCLQVPFDAIYSRTVCPQDVHCLVYP
ncbi:transposable element Tcb1 transposase [Trichonephila clavipes]|nr:transposable element Tcb1 transposase [Trichonephila clavipes]